jgi:hypothetical protein
VNHLFTIRTSAPKPKDYESTEVPITINVKGSREAAAAIRNLSRLAPAKLQAAVAESALNTRNGAIRRVPTDVGILKTSIRVEITNGGFTGQVIAGANYAGHIEFGTAPHFPPVAPLEEWARRHGMPGAGFAIARAISKRGTKAQPFLFPAYEDERPRFEARVTASIREAVRESAV